MFKYLIFLIVSLNTFAQRINIDSLGNEIYLKNNNGKYKESQLVLNQLIKSIKYNNSEKVAFYIFLSHTYKRLLDYNSSLSYLNLAQKMAESIEAEKDSINNIITVEKAFIYFDRNNYSKSDSLMNLLKIAKYKFLNNDNKAKINTQQAYILFLNKKYLLAEIKYKEVFENMKKTGSCDTPLLLVKQMELYFTLNKPALRDKYYNLAITNADSCHIFKYKIFATREILRLFKEKKDVNQVFKYQTKLDSLTKAYKLEDNLSILHNQRMQLLSVEKDAEINKKTWLFEGLLVLLGGAVLFFGIKLLRNKAKIDHVNKELLDMRNELNAYTKIQINEKENTKTNVFEENGLISERQKDVLKLIHDGMSNKEIAEKLFISENTVKYHIKNIYALLNLSDRKDIIKYLSKDDKN